MRITKQRIAEILNKGSVGDHLSRRVDLILSLLILANLIAVCLESVDSIAAIYGSQLLLFEMMSVTIFAIEYVLRVWSAPMRADLDGKTARSKRLQYAFSFMGIIDLLALLPSFLQWMIPGADLRWLRALRMVRLLKLSHYSSALEDLISAIYEERRAFGAALYLLGIALFLASALIYVAENHVQPEVFSSIPETMYSSKQFNTIASSCDVIDSYSFFLKVSRALLKRKSYLSSKYAPSALLFQASAAVFRAVMLLLLLVALLCSISYWY